MLSLLPSELIRTAHAVLAAAALAAVALPQAQAAGVNGQGTWEATLQGRDLDGNAATFEAYYDTVLDITWLADANYAQTTNYAAADIIGRMTWDEAKTWADNLVVGAYSDWRLPTMVDTGTSGCNFSTVGGTDCGYNVQTKDGSTVYSEMAHLYYVTLGNKGYVGASGSFQPDYGLQNTGPFSNVQSGVYWFGVEYAPANLTWAFATYKGFQANVGKNGVFSAWAVHSGDVAAAAVPEPQTYGLVLAGLAALMLARRRRA